MPGTDSTWNQDTPNSDLEIFIGATEWRDAGNHATIATPSAGVIAWTVPAAQTSVFLANIQAMIKRTGVFATPASVQQQYGTAASLPGPTQVANTSDPEGLRGYPPFTASKLATLIGPQAGAIPKGIQINSMDVIYSVNALNITAGKLMLNLVTYIDNTASPSVISLIPSTNNLTLTARANLYRTNIPVASPVFAINSGQSASLEVDVTTVAGGTFTFYGCVAKCSFNFN
jgi:hypothetical protein